MSSATKELIERIGACLPAEIRAAYYREMLYFQSLMVEPQKRLGGRSAIGTRALPMPPNQPAGRPRI
jgi:hypothetical protein